MSKSITLTGAYVRHVAIAVSNKDGAKTVRADFTVAWTEKVRGPMGWNDLKDEQNNVGLNGELSIKAMEFKVGDYHYNLTSGIAKAFHAVRVEDEKRSRVELRFQYTSNMPKVGSMLEDYIETTSRAKGVLSVQYDKIQTEEAEGDDQPTLPGVDAEE